MPNGEHFESSHSAPAPYSVELQDEPELTFEMTHQDQVVQAAIKRHFVGEEGGQTMELGVVTRVGGVPVRVIDGYARRGVIQKLKLGKKGMEVEETHTMDVLHLLGYIHEAVKAEMEKWVVSHFNQNTPTTLDPSAWSPLEE